MEIQKYILSLHGNLSHIIPSLNILFYKYLTARCMFVDTENSVHCGWEGAEGAIDGLGCGDEE